MINDHPSSPGPSLTNPTHYALHIYLRKYLLMKTCISELSLFEDTSRGNIQFLLYMYRLRIIIFIFELFM